MGKLSIIFILLVLSIEMAQAAPLKSFLNNATFKCQLGSGKKFQIDHYPDGTASIISNGIEAKANLVVHQNDNFDGLDYNIFKIRDIKNPSSELKVQKNMGFYVLSVSGNQMRVKPTRGGGSGVCTKLSP